MTLFRRSLIGWRAHRSGYVMMDREDYFSTRNRQVPSAFVGDS
jgi:hypothetical protein